jgi:pseudouridylate synthase
VETPAAAAGLARAQQTTGVAAAVLLCNPIPLANALDADELLAATDRAHARMLEDGVAGKEVTPYLLRALAEETGGRSLEANLVLLEENARLAAQVAVELSAATSGR